jgi:mRNA-degrading endonuclease toxin of MazEF toxin-antitoxin module
MKRGDVVIVDWPFFGTAGSVQSKPRPALVVQNDSDNARLTNTILAMITSMTRRSPEPTQLLIDITTPDGQRTGLRQSSVINCVNLLTVEKAKVLATIGELTPALMQKVNDCLKVALALQ